MNLQIKLLIWLASLGTVFACLFAAYEHGVKVEGLKQDKALLNERLTYAKAFDDGKTINEQIKIEGAKQHAKDTATIDRIRDDNSAFRLHFPQASDPATCADLSSSASRDMGNNTGSWSNSSQTQQAFDRFTVGLKQDSYDTEVVLNSCRVVMTWARGICKLNNNCQGAADVSGE